MRGPCFPQLAFKGRSTVDTIFLGGQCILYLSCQRSVAVASYCTRRLKLQGPCHAVCRTCFQLAVERSSFFRALCPLLVKLHVFGLHGGHGCQQLLGFILNRRVHLLHLFSLMDQSRGRDHRLCFLLGQGF